MHVSQLCVGDPQLSPDKITSTSDDTYILEYQTIDLEATGNCDSSQFGRYCRSGGKD